jgi:O-antigen/teichoic acid export membrane protein
MRSTTQSTAACSAAAATPARRGSIGGNFVWTSAGNAVYAACQWGMVSALARLGTPEIVGHYALGVSVTAPLLMLAQLNLRSVIATDVRGEHSFRDYRNVRLASLLLAMAVIVVMAIAGYRGAERWCVVLAGAAQAIEWLSDVFFGLLQREEQMKRIAISLAVRGPLSVAALAVAMALTGSVVNALAAVVAVRMAVFVLYDASAALRGVVDDAAAVSRTNGPHAPAWLSIVQTALPLGVVLMIGSLTINVPRYFIANQLGNHALGLFSAIASMTTAANLAVNALGQAATPRMARLYGEGDMAGFARLSWRLPAVGLGLGVCVVGGCLLLGRFVLGLFFGAEYARELGLLVTLAAAAGANYVAALLGYAITAGRRFKEQMPLQAAAVISTALACVVLVPDYGLQGAALAVGAGSVVQTLGSLWVLRSLLAAPRAAQSMPAAVAEGAAS